MSNSETMRIVLRHQQRPVYFGGAGTWVKDPGRALDFVNAIRALHYCVLNRLQAEVVPILEPASPDAEQPQRQFPPVALALDGLGRRTSE